MTVLSSSFALIGHYPARVNVPIFPEFPLGRTTARDCYEGSLAPAELPKQAASFDLPITLGILAGSGQFQSELFDQFAVVGELSLEGRTRPTKGALSMAIAAAEQRGLRGLVIPKSSAREAAVVENLEVIPVSNLAETVAFFQGQLDIDPTPSRLDELFSSLSHYDVDYSDVRGQELAKRALTIAAAGSHNLLMLGPPGSGKTVYITPHCTVEPAARLWWMNDRVVLQCVVDECMRPFGNQGDGTMPGPRPINKISGVELLTLDLLEADSSKNAIFSDRETFDIAGRSVQSLSRAAIIAMKRNSHRTKDRLDVELLNDESN